MSPKALLLQNCPREHAGKCQRYCNEPPRGSQDGPASMGSPRGAQEGGHEKHVRALCPETPMTAHATRQGHYDHPSAPQ
eukprot:8211073-Pyramimonas_sp.AAC.1